MALGKFADTNLAAIATLQGGVWSAAPLSLQSLKDDSRFVGAPARCPDCTLLANSQFEVVFSEVQLVNMVGLLFHTLTLYSKIRVTIAGEGDPTYAAPVLATGWVDVYPSLYDPVDLPWGVDNWWNGTVTQAEVDLFPRHRWMPIDEVLALKIKVEIDDRANPDGWFDVGGLCVLNAWSPSFNFERGRDLGLGVRDLVDEAPSGRLFNEERRPRRTLSVSYEQLTDTEVRRWFDAGLRARTTRTVYFLPDVDDPAALMREAFPAVFERPPGARFTYPLMNATAVTLKEILA